MYRVACLALLLGAAAVGATESCEPLPAVSTRSELQLRGGADGLARYETTYSRIPVPDESGVPQATISAIAYQRLAADTHGRPIVFAFNGGPGAAAGGLNFGLLGPKRWSAGDGARVLVDNPDTLLDVADLVMIDTPGSGFNCELRPDGLRYFWTAASDARAAEFFIRHWLTGQGRQDAPIYIVGESYGGYRIGVMSASIGDLNIRGAVLVSPALDLTDQPGTSGIPDDHYVFAFPTMAVAAAHHRRASWGVKAAEQIFEEASVFAQTELLAALHQGWALPSQQRDRLAKQMAAMIGLDAKTIVAANLRIDPQTFLDSLVPGQVVGRIDTRVTAAARRSPLVAGRDRAADDPALGMGASNLKPDPVVGEYLRGLGVTMERPYIGLNLDMNLNLDWAFGTRKLEDTVRLDPTSRIASLARSKAGFRVLLIGGYYDMTTPVLAARHALTHSDIPREWLKMIALPGPHAVYSDEATRSRVAEELRALIRMGNQSDTKPK